MKKRLFQTSLLLIVLGLILVSPSVEVFGADYSSASNYDRTYTFDVQYGYYRISHKLYVSVPPSLYDYYRDRSHSMRGDGDYSKFVTPEVFKSVAESIRNVTSDVPYGDEQFADAVLTLVHQLSYVKSNLKYPVENIIENSGDCDVLSLLAASIMKAGGLDVVLLYYKGMSPSHMNVGVYLPYNPVYRTWWMNPGSFEYGNKTYWMAECTSLAEWRVGDQPDVLAGAIAEVIPLENYEKSSPAQVSSSLDSPLNPSSISVSVSPENFTAGESWRTLNISGSILPAYSEKSVVVYVSQDGSSRYPFRTVSTDEFGNYLLTWNFTSTGTYHIRTSLDGFSNYTASDSEELTVFMDFSQSPSGDQMLSYYGGSANAVSTLYGISASQPGKKFLQSNLTGTTVLLSGEFIVLGNGENATTPKKEETITVPRLHVYSMPRTRGFIAIWENEQITVGNEQTTNNLGFTLNQTSGNNYTASVKVLSDNDLSRITGQIDGNNATFVNASNTKENTWYRVATKITGEEIVTELFDENGTLLRNLSVKKSAVSSNESGVLMTYDKSAVIAFKNLKAETLDQPAPPVDNSQAMPGNKFEPFVPYIGLVVLLAVAVVMIAYFKGTKKLKATQKTGS
jgi:hypothetical protein